MGTSPHFWTTNGSQKEKREILKKFDTNKNGNTLKLIGWNKNGSKKGVYNDNVFLKKKERSQIYNLSLHLKDIEKEKQTRCKLFRRKEIIKISADIY